MTDIQPDGTDKQDAEPCKACANHDPRDRHDHGHLSFCRHSVRTGGVPEECGRIKPCEVHDADRAGGARRNPDPTRGKVTPGAPTNAPSETTTPSRGSDRLEAVIERIAEYVEDWTWHEADAERYAGFGSHMAQLIDRMPRDRQTEDMAQAILRMIDDLQYLTSAVRKVVIVK